MAHPKGASICDCTTANNPIRPGERFEWRGAGCFSGYSSAFILASWQHQGIHSNPLNMWFSFGKHDLAFGSLRLSRTWSRKWSAESVAIDPPSANKPPDRRCDRRQQTPKSFFTGHYPLFTVHCYSSILTSCPTVALAYTPSSIRCTINPCSAGASHSRPSRHTSTKCRILY